MCQDDSAAGSARERDEVVFLARHDWSPAILDRARQIADPWYRCQALAVCATRGLRAEVSAVAAEALSAARDLVDPYRTTSVMAWPIAALIERGEIGCVPSLLEQALQSSRRIDHPVSRLEALFLVWQAAFPFQHAATESVFQEFQTSCSAANSWKSGERFATAVAILSHRDPRRARELAESMPEGKYKRRALRSLESKDGVEPKRFV